MELPGCLSGVHFPGKNTRNGKIHTNRIVIPLSPRCFLPGDIIWNTGWYCQMLSAGHQWIIKEISSISYDSISIPITTVKHFKEISYYSLFQPHLLNQTINGKSSMNMKLITFVIPSSCCKIVIHIKPFKLTSYFPFFWLFYVLIWYLA